MMFICQYQLFILLIVQFYVYTYPIDPWSRNLHDLIDKLQSFRDETIRREYEFNQAKYKFEQEKYQLKALVNPHDIVRLKLGDQIISTRRETLLKVPNSLLHSLFNGTFEHALRPDQDGTYFLDYDPRIFSYLLDQLRGLNPNETPLFRPPPSPSAAKSFNRMLNELRLPVAPRQGSDLVVLNVGGERIVTFRQTLLTDPESKLARLVLSDEIDSRDEFGRIILNYNPRLFRVLLSELRHGKKFNEIKEKDSLSPVDRTAFQKMVEELKEIKTTTTTTTTTTTVSWSTKPKKAIPRKQKAKKTTRVLIKKKTTTSVD